MTFLFHHRVDEHIGELSSGARIQHFFEPGKEAEVVVADRVKKMGLPIPESE